MATDSYITELNHRATRVLEQSDLADLKVASHRLECGAVIHDFGVNTTGGLQAGVRLAETCMSGLADIAISNGTIGDSPWPSVTVATDHPVEACLFSQYAGWQISVDKYFGMGSGPMRAATAREELFAKLEFSEQASSCVGVIESGKLPGDDVAEFIAERCGVKPDRVQLAMAPTSSLAGTIQVVARSVETSLHKLFELGFDVTRIESGFGTAPLPPVAKEDLTGIGLTNDAILYGGDVTLWVRGDDDSLSEIGKQVPASASDAYGKPFLQIFEDAGKDFYAIDPHLFSPGKITLHNLDTGRVHRFGQLNADVLRRSFALAD